MYVCMYKCVENVNLQRRILYWDLNIPLSLSLSLSIYIYIYIYIYIERERELERASEREEHSPTHTHTQTHTHTHTHTYICMIIYIYIYIVICTSAIFIIILVYNRVYLIIQFTKTIQFSISVPLVLFHPWIGPYQVLPRRARVHLGAMAMKGCSVFPKVPALL